MYRLASTSANHRLFVPKGKARIIVFADELDS